MAIFWPILASKGDSINASVALDALDDFWQIQLNVGNPLLERGKYRLLVLAIAYHCPKP